MALYTACMIIRFTKNTPTHHTFEVIRSDGSNESASLETKSFMPHDLIHFAYESLAGCNHSFYGMLASGTTLADFKTMDSMQSGGDTTKEMIVTERITGPLTAYLHGGISEDAFLATLQNMFDSEDAILPPHMTARFLKWLSEEYRGLIGQWNSLPHHVPMELVWKENS